MWLRGGRGHLGPQESGRDSGQGAPHTLCDSRRDPLLWTCPHSRDRTQSPGVTEQFVLIRMGGRPEKQPGVLREGRGRLEEVHLGVSSHLRMTVP